MSQTEILSQPLAALEQRDEFIARHLGPSPADVTEMLAAIDAPSLAALIDETVPAAIRRAPLALPEPRPEAEALAALKAIAGKNVIKKSLIGLGYADTLTPKVILRNVLENPGWYTAYTPYQAEISQGRLEGLLNFQTMVTELTAMEIANASLLDEATAAAEAMIMMFNTRTRSQEKGGVVTCLADEALWPQTKAVLDTRALPLGIQLEYVSFETMEYNPDSHFGIIL